MKQKEKKENHPQTIFPELFFYDKSETVTTLWTEFEVFNRFITASGALLVNPVTDIYGSKIFTCYLDSFMILYGYALFFR